MDRGAVDGPESLLMPRSRALENVMLSRWTLQSSVEHGIDMNRHTKSHKRVLFSP